jgi:tetratricopeptide (TPR) repeat protein
MVIETPEYPNRDSAAIEEKLASLFALLKSNQHKNPLYALSLADEATRLAAQSNKFEREQLQLLISQAVCEWHLERHTDAFKRIGEAKRRAESGQHLQERALSLKILGNFHFFLANYGDALECFFQSLELFETLELRAELAQVLNNIGNICDKRREYQIELNFLKQSLAIKESLGDKHSLANTLNNIGNAYEGLSQYESALTYYEKSLTIKQEINDKRGVASTLGNIGNLMQESGKTETALKYFYHSLAIAQEIGDKRLECFASLRIGKARASQS